MQETSQIKSLIPGTTLCNGKYVIEKVLGEGGFGITYYAKHTMLNHYYAIKEFFISGRCIRNTVHHTISLQDISKDVFNKFRDRFVDEAKTLIELDHPGIVKVADIFEENGTSYIVMNFLKGETLQSKVEHSGPLDYGLAVNYMAQLSDAVAYIHDRHILHRDIKPDNVMITPDNKVVLIDFGSAREFVNDEFQKHTTILTKGYAPPEQYTSSSKKGNYSDIYSLGAVFYFALTGVKPIDAATRTIEQLASPFSINPDIPIHADRTIMKAMELQPSARYQSAAEFLQDLLGGSDTSDISGQEERNDDAEQSELSISAKNKASGKKPFWWIMIVLVIIAVVAVLLLSKNTNLTSSLSNEKIVADSSDSVVVNSSSVTEKSEVTDDAIKVTSTEKTSDPVKTSGESKSKPSKTGKVESRKTEEPATTKEIESVSESNVTTATNSTTAIVTSDQNVVPVSPNTNYKGLKVNGEDVLVDNLKPAGGVFEAIVSLEEGNVADCSVDTEDPWITNMTLGQDGLLKFSYEKNGGEGERRGKVSVLVGTEIVTINLFQKNVPIPIYENLWYPKLSRLLERSNLSFDNGDAYRGQVINEVERDGIGLYKWGNGHVYFGNYKKNVQEGRGVYMMLKDQYFAKLLDCRFLVSDFKNNQPNGSMRCYDGNGKILYDGPVYNWSPEGKYPDDNLSTSRKFEYIQGSNGEHYVGETLNGKRDGFGISFTASGDAWVGEWIQGRKANGNPL